MGLLDINEDNKRELWNYMKTSCSAKYIPVSNQFVFTNKDLNNINIVQWEWDGSKVNIDLGKVSKFVGEQYLNGSKDYINFIGYDISNKPLFYMERLDCSKF